MNRKFTVEESNLISIFMDENAIPDKESRRKVIQGISEALGHLEDDEMVELSLRVIVKLNDLADQEFAELEFVASE